MSTKKPPFSEAAKQVVLPLFWCRNLDSICCIGSLFIIASGPGIALAVTARHTMDYIRRESGMDDLGELSIPADFRRYVGLEMLSGDASSGKITKEGILFTIFKDNSGVALIDSCDHMAYQSVDVAFVTLTILSFDAGFLPAPPLLTKGPLVGESVTIFGFANQGNVAISKVHEGTSVATAKFSIPLQDQTRIGNVIETFSWSENYLLKSPGFTVNKAVSSGISGGAVFVERNNEYAICGMLSASNEDFSYASLIYPSLALKIRKYRVTALELCKNGAIRDLSQAGEYLQFNIRSGIAPEHFATWRA